MISVSALERMLITERYRQRAAPDGGFSTPVMLERQVEAKDEPILVSSTRGDFVPTRRTRDGTARYAFFRCPLGEEKDVLVRLFRSITDLSRSLGWGSAVKTVPEGLNRFLAYKIEAKSLVLSFDVLKETCGEDLTPEAAEKAMLVRGYVTEVGGLRVLVAPLPPRSAILAAVPALTGVYTRVGDYLGLQLLNVRQNLVVVSDGVDR